MELRIRDLDRLRVGQDIGSQICSRASLYVMVVVPDPKQKEYETNKDSDESALSNEHPIAVGRVLGIGWLCQNGFALPLKTQYPTTIQNHSHPCAVHNPRKNHSKTAFRDRKSATATLGPCLAISHVGVDKGGLTSCK
jgi:hypothetical protein